MDKTPPKYPKVFPIAGLHVLRQNERAKALIHNVMTETELQLLEKIVVRAVNTTVVHDKEWTDKWAHHITIVLYTLGVRVLEHLA